MISRTSFLFLCSLLVTTLVQGLRSSGDSDFLTIHHYIYDKVEPAEVREHMAGQKWLETKLSQEPLDLMDQYNQKALARTLEDKSKTHHYQKSYTTWVEEKTCPESPYIDKPMRARMTSRFGRRFHPLSGRSHVHAGIDFRGRRGTPVLASSRGKVKSASRKGAYGKTIILEHGNRFTTLYGHLSGYAVKPGQWVNLGQTIGYVGATGRATGPHLHFEVRCHNVPLNPNKYIGHNGIHAEVKFKRRRRSVAGRNRPRHIRRPARVSRDPNYYTRMINLEKLRKLKKTN